MMVFGIGGGGHSHSHSHVQLPPNQRVGGRIDEPSGMQVQTIAEEGSRAKGNPNGFAPKEDGNGRWQKEAENGHKGKVISGGGEN